MHDPKQKGLSSAVEVLIENGMAWQEGAADMSAHYFDTLIIGSGYGAAVAAARLAEANDSPDQRRIAVLERGREFPSQGFPDSLSSLVGETRIHPHDTDKIVGKPQALFDVRLGKTINVLLANGLGGGSLINAAVVEPAHPDVWLDPRWPSALKNAHTAMQPFYTQAKTALGARPMDQWNQGNQAQPIKLKNMKSLAAQFKNTPYRTVDIAIDGERCTQCGDCFTGCNFDAKNSLPQNYLHHAKTNGVEMYTGATVSHIEKHLDANQETQWWVYFILSDAQSHPSRQQKWILSCKRLIVAAGTLGSTEILQRSAALQSTLKFSPALGKNFSCNGDMIWMGYNQTELINSIADPEQVADQRRVGPTIASMIDLRDQDPNQGQAHVIQDASIPGALKRLFEELSTSLAVGYRMAERDTEIRSNNQDVDAIDPEKQKRSAVYLTMGRDEALGEIRFHPHPKKKKTEPNTGLSGRSHAHWGAEDEKAERENPSSNNINQQKIFAATENSMQAVSKLGGTLIASPFFRAGPQSLVNHLSGPKRLGSTLTVHPLGGCPMGDGAATGVVNHFGAVFDAAGTEETALHQNLYVIDGAIIPCALGINPLLTITALAERAIPLILQHENHAAAAPNSDSPNTNSPITKRVSEKVQARTPHICEKTQFQFREIMEWERDSAPASAFTQFADSQAWKKIALVVQFQLGETKLTDFLRDPQRRVEISDAELIFYTQQAAQEGLQVAQKIKLIGHVDWLHETQQEAQDKEVDSFTRYLRSRAIADLDSRKDLSWLTRTIASKAVALFNFFNLRLSHLTNRLLSLLNQEIRDLQALATHTGGHRILGYRLSNSDNAYRLLGGKNVNYSDGSNLWRSLGEMPVQLSLPDGSQHNLELKLNWRKIFEDSSFQIETNAQGLPNNPDVWMDLMSVGAFWARALARIHFWSFRLPEIQSEKRSPQRPVQEGSVWYPQTLMDHKNQAVEIGVTHFPRKVKDQGLPPLLLIHGFGASGLQFHAPGEQKSLLDFLQEQGRDVWIAELRTSIAMNQAIPEEDAQWSLDEVAMNDIPAIVRFIGKHTQVQQIDVLAHCIGSAMFNIAVLSGKLQNSNNLSLIRSAALLQVGPIFTVSKDNKTRAYTAHSLMGGFDVDFVDSSTDVSSEDWERSMIDRLLNSYPIPTSELHSADERKSVTPVYPGNQWLANYFRSTGVFGRLFQIKNMSYDMLNQLGALLGRTNFKTFEQIIDCIMRNRLVDEYGRNIYVSAQNLKQYYSFPVKFFYGEENDVFHRWGVINSVAQLRAAHGFPEDITSPQNNSPFQWEIFPDYGHLDPLVGENSARDCYPQFAAFFKSIISFKTAPSIPRSACLRAPDYGPIVGWTRKNAQNEWVSRIWVLARETAGLASHVVVYRMQNNQLADASLQVIALQGPNQYRYACVDVVDCTNSEEIRFSVLHMYSQAGSGGKHISLGNLPEDFPANAAIPTSTINPEPSEVLNEVASYHQRDQLNHEKKIEEQINALESKHQDFFRSVNPIIPTEKTRRFALGSCRYSGMMVEQLRNNTAYSQLKAILDDPAHRPEFALLMGDQIYADATGGTADTNQIQAYHSFYHRSLARKFNDTSLAAAEVFCRLPVLMMLDDHEVRDNWIGDDDDSAKKKNWSRAALSTFTAFQWSHGPRNTAWTPGNIPAENIPQRTPFWTQFQHEEIAIFMLDTRTERNSPTPAAQAHIINENQWAALTTFLAETNQQQGIRLIISPSQIHQLDGDHPQRSDAWSAYPNDLKRLCQLLSGAKKLALVCGDHHAHGVYSLNYYQGQKKEQEIPIIVASPLYAPYPFTNPSLDQDWEKTCKLVQLDESRHVQFQEHQICQDYQGFVQCHLHPQDTENVLELFKADGVTPLFPEHTGILLN